MGRTATLINKSCPGCGTNFQVAKSVERTYCTLECYQRTQASQKNVVTVVPVQPPQKQEKSKSVTKGASPALKVIQDASAELESLIGEDTSVDGRIRNHFGDWVAIFGPQSICAAVGIEVAVFFTHGGWSTDWIRDTGNVALAVTAFALEAVICALTYRLMSLQKEIHLVPPDYSEKVDGVVKEVRFGYRGAIKARIVWTSLIWVGLSIGSGIAQYAFLSTEPNANVFYNIVRVLVLVGVDAGIAYGLPRRPISAQEYADRKVHVAKQIRAIALATIEADKIIHGIVPTFHEAMGNSSNKVSVEEVL